MLYDPYLDAPQWWTGSSWVGAKGASVAVDYDGTTVSTARPVINFIGPAVLVADNSGANSADVTVYITADPEVTHPAFAITLNHLTASLLEVNDITPNTNLFSADRNYTASTVTLTTAVNGVGTGENTNVSAAFAGGTPPTAPSSPTTSAPFTSVRAPFTGTSYGYYVTATLTAIRNSFLTRVATATFFWTQKVYFDVSAIPGSYNGAFILSLAGSLKTTKNGAYTTASPAGPGQYIYFACRSAYGPATFSIGGFNGGLSLVPGGPFAVTNSHGFVENYDLYRSDNSNLGNTTVVVS
jgi:hypothetical protein